ncbi:hypothetical protein D9M68_1008220 [compost metagenome]
MGQLEHGAAEVLEGVAGFVVQADFDEHQQAGLQVLRVQPGVVAEDDALAFQAADALGAGRSGKADALAELGEGDAAVLLEDS